MERPVVLVGHPVLHRPSAWYPIADQAEYAFPSTSWMPEGEPVACEPDVDLGRDLIDTMRVSPGCIGLAAPQIGVAKRAFALDVSEHFKAKKANHGLVVLFNPVIVARDGLKVEREGCMSVPDFTANVQRWRRITVAGTSMDGELVHLDCKMFEARAMQHEMDHLDGLIILDRVSRMRDDIYNRQTYLPAPTADGADAEARDAAVHPDATHDVAVRPDATAPAAPTTPADLGNTH